MKKQCKNCGVDICRGSKSGLCRSCVKGGQGIKAVQHKCMVCGNSITGRGKHNRCIKCSKLKDLNPNYGNPSNYIPKTKGMTGIHYKNFPSRKGKDNPMFGKTRKGIKAGFFGKHHSEETKRKKRLKMIEYYKTKKNGMQPNYNKNSIKIIEQYGKEHGYNFQHAENGGEFYIKELGYWVDGYDKDKNVVIEYYETHHKSKTDKDENRINEIKKFLNCQVIILKEWELS